MGAADEVHVVFLQEARDDVGAEGERDTTVVFAPAGDILVGIGPQQIAKETAVGDLQGTCQWGVSNDSARAGNDIHPWGA